MEIGSSKMFKSKGLVFANFLSKSEDSSSDWYLQVKVLTDTWWSQETVTFNLSLTDLMFWQIDQTQ